MKLVTAFFLPTQCPFRPTCRPPIFQIQKLREVAVDEDGKVDEEAVKKLMPSARVVQFTKEELDGVGWAKRVSHICVIGLGFYYSGFVVPVWFLRVWCLRSRILCSWPKCDAYSFWLCCFVDC